MMTEIMILIKSHLKLTRYPYTLKTRFLLQFLMGKVLMVHVSKNEIRVPKNIRRKFREKSYILLRDKLKVFNGERGLFNPIYIDEVLGLGMYILSVEPQNSYIIKTVEPLKVLKKEFTL